MAIPSMLYAGTLMTEVALYPTFVLALLAITVALERPKPMTQLAALAAIALACSGQDPGRCPCCCVRGGDRALTTGSIHAERLRDGEPGCGFAHTTGFVLVAIAVASLTALLASGRRPQDTFGGYSLVLEYVETESCAAVGSSAPLESSISTSR